MGKKLTKNVHLAFLKDQKFCELASGHKMAYIDSGDGEAVIMVHGNPTWSFFYRNLIKALNKEFRCIAPDNMGFGFSERASNKGEYSLASHIQNLEELIIEKLKLKNFHLVVHDWGGPIGLALAAKYADRVKNVVILNTAAFISKDVPKRIRICRTKGLGKFLVRGLNAFVEGLLKMGTYQRLPPLIKEGYRLPYNTWEKRKGIYELLREIPVSPKTASYQIIEKLEKKLFYPFHFKTPAFKMDIYAQQSKSSARRTSGEAEERIEIRDGGRIPTCNKAETWNAMRIKKVLIMWGGKDFCFHDEFYKEWKKRLPQAQCVYLKQAGHLVLEDAGECGEEAIKGFLKNVL